MEHDFVDGAHVFTLSQDEGVLVLSALTHASELIASDESFKFKLGWERKDYWDFVREFADYLREAP